MTRRRAGYRRETRETCVTIDLTIEGTGCIAVETGLGFLDHMLTALAFHAGFDLRVEARGDLEVDDHHTSEDVALALGTTLERALGDRAGLARFATAFAPLDEALARVVIDLSGRPSPVVALDLRREAVGGWATENVTHFFRSFATTLGAALHVDVLRGENDHHRIEAAFKALALALREAVAVRGDLVPSTKGVLS